MSTLDFTNAPLAPGSPLVPPVNRQLGQNPMLPALPATGDLDSQYLADEAALRQQIGQQYGDVLQQLGWSDENGNFIPGSLSVQAGRQASSLARSSNLAAEDVTNQATRDQTLFSSRRALDTARAQFPFQTQIGQLGVDIPVALGGLYERAAGLIDQYVTANNRLLAAMAQRRAAAIAQAPGTSPGDTGPGGPEAPTAPTDTGPAPEAPPSAGQAGEGSGGGGTRTTGGINSGFETQERPTAQTPYTPLNPPDQYPYPLDIVGAGGGTSSGGINSGPEPYERGGPLVPATPLPPEPVTPPPGYGANPAGQLINADQVYNQTTGYNETEPGAGYVPSPYPTFTPPAAPEPPPPEPAPEDNSIFLATLPSDHPLVPLLQQIAQPITPPPGYGGGRNAAQVRRNNL